MPTVTATIEIDCPAGYEPVAFRVPLYGAHFVTSSGTVEVCECHHTTPRLILRPVWTPAPWMPKGAWLYCCDSDWLLHKNKPKPSRRYRDGCWHNNDSGAVNATNLAGLHGETFVPPPTREPVQIT